MPSRDTVVTFLAACGLTGHAQAPWLTAWERVSTAHLRRPAGAVRVREARPRLLGVHASIQVDPAASELPAFVPRDFDTDLRTAVNAAAEQGGFVLLVGGSSVGKTRALFEAVRAELSEWWLVHPNPADPDAVRPCTHRPQRLLQVPTVGGGAGGGPATATPARRRSPSTTWPWRGRRARRDTDDNPDRRHAASRGLAAFRRVTGSPRVGGRGSRLDDRRLSRVERVDDGFRGVLTTDR